MPAAPRTSVHGCFEPGGRGRPQLVEKGSDGLAGFGAEGVEASGAVSSTTVEIVSRADGHGTLLELAHRDLPPEEPSRPVPVAFGHNVR
jgi:hypothetical protein